MAHAAALTRRMRLGVAVLLAAQREPLYLAKMLTTIDVLSCGRLVVGVGVGQGTRDYSALGLAPDRRVARFRENLEIIRRLWTEDRVTHAGQFARLEGVPMEPKPVQKPHPPVWFGAHVERALRRAVELGDGFMGAGSSSVDEFLSELQLLRGFLGTRTGFPIGKRLYVSCKNDLSRMEEWFGAFYHRPEMARKVAVWGSPGRVVEEVERLLEAGTTHILLHPVTDEEEQLELLASSVLTRFR